MAVHFSLEKDPHSLLAHVDPPAGGMASVLPAQNIMSTQQQRVTKEWEQSESVGLHLELLLEPLGEKCSPFLMELVKGLDVSHLATRGGMCLRAELKAELTDAESRSWSHPT